MPKSTHENQKQKPIYFSSELVDRIQLYADLKHRKSFTAAVSDLCLNALGIVDANTEIKAMYAAARKDPVFRKHCPIKVINALRLK